MVKQIEKMSADALNVFNAIAKSGSAGIGRVGLSMATGLSDRAVREQISQIRRVVPIINRKSAYFIPSESDRAEVAKWVKQETNRARSIFWSLKAARNWLVENLEDK